MLNVGVVILLLQISAPVAIDPAQSVRGAVRSDPTGVPVAGARVELIDGSGGVESASTGEYSIPVLTAGAHRLRFSARGYQPLTIDVRVTAGLPLTLDVALVPVAARLPSVRVLAPPRLRGRDTSDVVAEAGAWSASGDAVRSSLAINDADAFRLLASAPQAHMLPESPASVHVRGGSADQNLFLLDGAPVFSPVHPGQLLSAFNPDIIETLVLHGGAPSARYGGQLSSIVDVQTPSTLSSVVTTRGALGPTAMRGFVELPIVPGRAGLILSGRHSYSGLRRQNLAETSMPGTWFDLFGKFSVRAGGNDFTVSSFSSDNGLGFPSAASQTDSAPRIVARNAFEWTAATQSVSWRRDFGARTKLDAIAWRARLDAAALWNPDTLSIALASSVRNDGGAVSLVQRHTHGQLTAGTQVERLSSSYNVSKDVAEGSGTALLRRSSRPVVRSLFAEERWNPSEAWSLVTGLRTAFVTRKAPRFEPRISIAYAPRERWAISAGYARMHQYSQSLRGEESLLGTIVGPDLLVGVGSGLVPVARSDELTASASLRVTDSARLRFDGYARRLHGIIVPDGNTTEPFATRSYAIGSGQAWGLSSAFATHWDRLSLAAGYALNVATRATDSSRYRPSFAPRQSMTLALGYRATSRTLLHSALWAATGRRTTTVRDDIEWDTRDALSGAREVTGSPQHIDGSLGSARLPFYFRCDVGVRYTMSPVRVRSQVTAFGGVNNLFARENKTGYVKTLGANLRRDLLMLPTSVVIGLEWHY